MKCCVLIDIGRTWLKFISHSLLLLQRNKGFFFFNPKNRKPSYLCGVKRETGGSLFEKQHLMFPLFSNQTTGHFCITHPQSPCFGILSCQELLTADKLLCVEQCLPSQIPEPTRERKGLCLKQGEDMCLDALLLSCSRSLFLGQVVLSIPKQSIICHSLQTLPKPLLICSLIYASNH